MRWYRTRFMRATRTTTRRRVIDVDSKLQPLLTTTDWNEEWKRLQKRRGRSDDSKTWDEKAKSFPVKHGSQEGYASRFIELAGLNPGESVFDMGCGTGALATPLALAGHNVLACDFSKGMIDAMVRDQAELGVEGVESRLLSWSDDWTAHGIDHACRDVAIASRSIATYDLEDALRKLDWIAGRRACITLPSLSSPRLDDRLVEAAGVKREIGRDFLYAFNILASWGVLPEVSAIPSPRRETFATADDARSTYTGIVMDAISHDGDAPSRTQVDNRIGAWLDRELVEGDSGFRLKEDRVVTWAFIAWESTGTLWF